MSRSSSLHPDDASHTTDPVFELDEERAVERGQYDSEKSEESSSGPTTPSPATPILDGLSSPPEDVRKTGLGYNLPTTATPVPTPIAHMRNISHSVPETPANLNDAPVAVPHSAPSEKVSHGSKMWNKFVKSGSNRGKKLNAALDKTGTLVRVMSAGFSSKSSKT